MRSLFYSSVYGNEDLKLVAEHYSKGEIYLDTDIPGITTDWTEFYKRVDVFSDFFKFHPVAYSKMPEETLLEFYSRLRKAPSNIVLLTKSQRLKVLQIQRRILRHLKRVITDSSLREGENRD